MLRLARLQAVPAAPHQRCILPLIFNYQLGPFCGRPRPAGEILSEAEGSSYQACPPVADYQLARASFPKAEKIK